VDANQSWRSGSVNRVQAFLLVVYPVASLPVLLAYGARYAFDSSIAFYAVLAIDAVLGIIVYFISLDSAVSTAHEQKEQFLTALSRSQGPLAG
jgi:ABC-2 type transport system permease protein